MNVMNLMIHRFDTLKFFYFNSFCDKSVASHQALLKKLLGIARKLRLMKIYRAIILLTNMSIWKYEKLLAMRQKSEFSNHFY